MTITCSRITMLALAAVLTLGIARAQAAPDTSATNAPLVFSGGHDTDPRDHGRPVVLIAAALGVTPQVFRDAFSRVHPAGPGSNGPTGDEARANKKVLMEALSPHGITNDRLDEVSNHYRYRAWKNEMWPTKPAAGYALVKDGHITGFVITDGGSGYSSPPTVTMPSVPNAAAATAQLAFDKDFAKNGAVSAVELTLAKSP